MRKPRLILHIGLYKTGTSTIQHTLLVHDARLREAGIHLPDRLGREDGGHHLATGIFKNKGPEAFLAHIRKDNNYPTTVLSAEPLVEIVRQPKMLNMLSAALQPYFETEIVLFLRRQDYLKESMFAQLVKLHIKKTIQQHTYFIYDFEPYVTDLERVFGRQNVKLVLYRDDQRFDSWAAFCRILAINPQDYEVSAGNPNASLPRRKTLALSMMRKPSRQIANVTLSAISKPGSIIRNDGIRWLMAPDERRELLRQFMPMNRRICDRYNLVEGAEFFCSGEIPAGDWYPPEPISSEEWAELAAAIAAEVVERRAKRKRDTAGNPLPFRPPEKRLPAD